MTRQVVIVLICLTSQLLMGIPIFGQTVTFVASTPCSIGTRPLPGIPQGKSGCELIKWRLQLKGTTDKENAGTYILDYDYGMPKQGTRGFINGGNHLHREGKWVIINATPKNSSSVIYRLDPDKPAESISFMRLNENLLHLLDDHGQLMIGTGAWSYTLSRVKQ
jgi:hypothetical protein